MTSPRPLAELARKGHSAEEALQQAALETAVMRQFGISQRRVLALWLAAALSAWVAMGAAGEPAARPAKTLTWPELLQRSQAVVQVEMADPVAKQTSMDGGGLRDFVRHQRRMNVTAVLAGREIAVGQTLLVDDVDWRGDLAQHRRCRALQRKQPSAICPQLPDKDGLSSQLSREPGPGQVVLVAVRKVDGDWQLAAERAMDSAELRPQVEQWLRQGKGGRR